MNELATAPGNGTTNERRRYRRVKVLCRISVAQLPEVRNATDTVESNWYTTVDISRQGLRYKSQQEILPNSFIRVDLVRRTPKDGITLMGLVRWCSKFNEKDMYYDVGVELIDTGDDSWEKWTSYVEQRVTDSPEA